MRAVSSVWLERSAHIEYSMAVLKEGKDEIQRLAILMRNRVVVGSNPTRPTQRHRRALYKEAAKGPVFSGTGGQPTSDNNVKRLALALFSDRETCVGASGSNPPRSTQGARKRRHIAQLG